MKPLVIKLLIGLIGFGGGFAAGFYAHKKINDVKIEEITKEEMDVIEEKLNTGKKEKAPEAKDKEAEKEDILKADEELPENKEELQRHLQKKTPYIKADEETKTAYEKMWKATREYSSEENANNIPTYAVNGVKQEDIDEAEEESPIEEDFDEDFLESIEREAEEAGNDFMEPPHQISLVEFYNEHPEYDQVTIKWYQEDNVWVDENDEIIPDISSYTGIEGKNPFDEKPLDDDEDTRFWVNPHYGSNYEFIRHHRSYRETVGE